MNLSQRSGLPLELDLRGPKLTFGKEVVIEEQNNRHAQDLAPVLAAQPRAEEERRLIYTVFRGVSLRQDQALWLGAGLRYDITSILPGTIGQEFSKTFGHIHGRSIFELYQVIHGRTYALIERWEARLPAGEAGPAGRRGAKPREAFLVEVGAGESYVVPPGFGHVTTNPFDQPLVLANVIARDVEQDYSTYEKHHGGSYYVIESEVGREFADIIPNPHLAEHSPIKKVRPHLPRELSFLKERPLYHIVYLAQKDPKAIQLLKQSGALGIKDPEMFFHVIG